MVFFWGLPSLSRINIFKPFFDVTLEIATYSCPCEKTGLGRKSPTSDNDCPWLLFIVIVKATAKGNCRLHILKGNLVSDGVIKNHRIYTISPTLSPVMILASTIKSICWVIYSLVPFINPSVGAIFLRTITWQPTLSLRLWFGNPNTLIVFRKSGPRASSPIEILSIGSILSALMYIFSSPGMTIFNQHRIPQNKKDFR